MSGRFPSRPRIVPVAFANLDKPAWSAVFSCVVKPAFSLEERGVDVNDRESLGRFLDAFRHEFRGHVEEATELARRLEAPDPDLTGIVTNLGDVDAVHEEFEFDVRSIELRSADLEDRSGTTVFYGSSTFRQWHTLARDMALADSVNLGFGGATLDACRHYFERLVMPYQPTRLIIYCGENDLADGASAGSVADRFQRLAERAETCLPETRFWFVSVKPTPAREGSIEVIKRANSQISAKIDSRDRWHYIDWFPHMLDGEGRPDARLFTPDGVHLNRDGYSVLAKLLRQELSETRGGP